LQKTEKVRQLGPHDLRSGKGRRKEHLVRVEVVILRIERECAIDFEERLRIWIGLLDETEIHLPDAGFGGVELGAEFRIEHQALAAVRAGLIARGRLAGCLARELESEGGHAMRRAGIPMASIARADFGRPSDIEMIAVLGEEIDTFLRHGLGKRAAFAWRHAHELFEFRMKALKQFWQGWVHGVRHKNSV
jgi:hypothetical protein